MSLREEYPTRPLPKTTLEGWAVNLRRWYENARGAIKRKPGEVGRRAPGRRFLPDRHRDLRRAHSGWASQGLWRTPLRALSQALDWLKLATETERLNISQWMTHLGMAHAQCDRPSWSWRRPTPPSIPYLARPHSTEGFPLFLPDARRRKISVSRRPRVDLAFNPFGGVSRGRPHFLFRSKFSCFSPSLVVEQVTLGRITSSVQLIDHNDAVKVFSPLE